MAPAPDDIDQLRQRVAALMETARQLVDDAEMLGVGPPVLSIINGIVRSCIAAETVLASYRRRRRPSEHADL
jgi:hypothetical protein